MNALVTLAQAKLHLRIVDDTTHDADISLKIAMASEIVLHHHKLSTVPSEWLIGSPVTIDAPPMIQAATLLVLGELFANREGGVANVLSDAVKSLIPRIPTLA